MEKWDLYNKNRELMGLTHVRGEIIPNGYYHLVVHVWIKNSKGEFLISQRSKNRPSYPLLWECVGVSVLAGENSLQGAMREVKEEIGVDLLSDSGKVIFTKTRTYDIMDVWLFEYDGDLHLDDATTDEVSVCRWMTVSQIRKLYEDNRLVQTLDYFFCAMEVDQNTCLS